MEPRYLKEWESDLHRCIRCGYCFEGCPVYKALDWEVDGARGKVIMAYGLMTGELKASAYIAEKLYQCTFCRDCVERCSAQVSVPDILSAARADLWEEGFGMDAHRELLDKVTTSGNIFAKTLAPPEFRGEQAVLLGCRLLERNEDANHYLTLLKALGVNPRTFDEVCCGMPYGVLGDKRGFQDQQEKFRKTIPNLDDEILCVCTTCVFFLRKKYPDLKAKYIVEEIVERLEGNHLPIKKLGIKATYHDPCNVARGLNMVDEPRWLLNRIGVDLAEMETYGKEARCCGGGGGVLVTDTALSEKLADSRVEEAQATGADFLVTLCPTCELNLKNAAERSGATIRVRNVLDLVYEAVV